jgi:hypothetical protein
MVLFCAFNAENEPRSKRIKANDFFIPTTTFLKIAISSEKNMI